MFLLCYAPVDFDKTLTRATIPNTSDRHSGKRRPCSDFQNPKFSLLMHQALQTIDILAQIFHFLRLLSHDPTMWAWREDDADFQVNPRHCLSAALTCKTFLEPALNMLWYACNSLERLVGLIEGVKTRPLAGESEDHRSNKGIQNMVWAFRRLVLAFETSSSHVTSFSATSIHLFRHHH